MLVVEFQRDNSRPARGGQADNLRPILTPPKVLVPALLARVKQGSLLVSDRIETVRLDAFVTVAQGTGEPEVVLGGRPTRSDRDDVLNVHGHSRKQLWSEAVTAAMTRDNCHFVL